jgi:endonuclease/exonuclease/phosphatase family metal-dependent hydrolase
LDTTVTPGQAVDRIRSSAPCRPWSLFGLALVLALGVSCATVNYLDPSGPSHETRFADASASPPPPGSPLRVVTFNVAYAAEIDLAIDVLQKTPELRNPDVLALQEMDPPGTERIAQNLGMNSVFVPSAVHPRTGRDFGCAILSPWPLVEPGKVVLPIAAFGSGVRRSAARVTVLRGEERLRFYSVHLPSPLGVTGAGRRQQIEVLLADAAVFTGPVVIAGDFNSHDVGKQFMEAGYSWPTRDVGTTSKFLFFGMSIDHIFARGLDSQNEVEAVGAIEDNRGASDHRPVWAVLVAPDPVAGDESSGS